MSFAWRKGPRCRRTFTVRDSLQQSPMMWAWVWRFFSTMKTSPSHKLSTKLAGRIHSCASSRLFVQTSQLEGGCGLPTLRRNLSLTNHQPSYTRGKSTFTDVHKWVTYTVVKTKALGMKWKHYSITHTHTYKHAQVDVLVQYLRPPTPSLSGRAATFREMDCARGFASRLRATV